MPTTRRRIRLYERDLYGHNSVYYGTLASRAPKRRSTAAHRSRQSSKQPRRLRASRSGSPPPIGRLQPGAPPLTARELAGLSGVELKTVHNWVRRGLLSHFRTPGRHLRFHPEDAVEFLARCGYATAGPAAQNIDRSRALVIAAGRARTALRRALRDLPVSWADEPWSGLIAAGREWPSAVVLEASALRSTDARAVIRALTRQLAHARVVWVGAVRPPLAALRWISLSDLRALRAELGLV